MTRECSSAVGVFALRRQLRVLHTNRLRNTRPDIIFNLDTCSEGKSNLTVSDFSNLSPIAASFHVFLRFRCELIYSTIKT